MYCRKFLHTASLHLPLSFATFLSTRGANLRSHLISTDRRAAFYLAVLRSDFSAVEIRFRKRSKRITHTRNNNPWSEHRISLTNPSRACSFRVQCADAMCRDKTTFSSVPRSVSPVHVGSPHEILHQNPLIPSFETLIEENKLTIVAPRYLILLGFSPRHP